MKVYVYVVLLKEHVMCICTSVEQARQSLLEQGHSDDRYLLSVEEMKAQLEDMPDMVVFMEKACSDFRMYRKPLIGELPKPTSKVTIGITPKQLKQEQAELKSLPIFEVEEVEENEVEINNQIDQAKEDEQLPW